MRSVYNPNDNRQIADILNQVVQQFDNCGTITLAQNSTTTTVTNPKITKLSKVVLSPRTAAAASENYFISSIQNNSFTVTHSSATAERIFDYVLFVL